LQLKKKMSRTNKLCTDRSFKKTTTIFKVMMLAC